MRRYLVEIVFLHAGIAIGDEAPVILGLIIGLYEIIYFRIGPHIRRADNELRIHVRIFFNELSHHADWILFAVMLGAR